MSTQNSVAWVLFSTPRSPFARRIRLALERLGFSYEIRWIDLFHPTDEFLQANPLALVPVLQDLRSGTTYPDSNAILETLHDLSGGLGIWPADRAARMNVRRVSSLIAGVLNSVVARYLEGLRPQDQEHDSWMIEHEQNIQRTLESLRECWGSEQKNGSRSLREPSKIEEFTQADWDLVVLLEYLDLRWPEWSWREKAPGWEKWLNLAQEQAFFRSSKPPV